MKLFRVTADYYGYDQCDTIIVAAHDKKEAAKLCVSNSVKSSVRQLTVDDLEYEPEIDEKPEKTRFKYNDTDGYAFDEPDQSFSKHQSPLTVTEIDLQNLTEPQQILGSFNAG